MALTAYEEEPERSRGTNLRRVVCDGNEVAVVAAMRTEASRKEAQRQETKHAL